MPESALIKSPLDPSTRLRVSGVSGGSGWQEKERVGVAGPLVLSLSKYERRIPSPATRVIPDPDRESIPGARSC